MKAKATRLAIALVPLIVASAIVWPACADYYKSLGIMLRGDSNNDGVVDVSDPIHLANWLFDGGQAPECNRDAADVDDNGTLNATDVLRLLGYLYNNGTPPASPFPIPGCDTSEDDVDICSSPLVPGVSNSHPTALGRIPI